MMIIPNCKSQQETEQTKAVESKMTVGAKKSGDSKEILKKGTISVRRRAFDQYVSEKDGEEKSYGHYQVVSDGGGNSKVRFDDPGRNLKEKAYLDPAEQKNSDNFDQGKKLQKLKRKQQQLKQKIKSETDPEKAKELKRKLTQTEREIRAKGK